MSNDIAIKIENLSKCYHIYDQPRDRLKQMILPHLQRVVGAASKQYFREFWALKDVSFEVKKGETVGIIGRNGSGKSTLLQMICGTLNSTSGSIQTNGRIAALLELGSGFNPEFTGRENVYLNGAVLGLSKDEINSRFDEIAAFADIGEFIDQPVKTYSSGMFVRLAFSIQANVEPEILIVDEALAVGDAHFVHRCMLRFHELQAIGTTILFVSHASASVTQLCDRAIWLEEGKFKLEGSAPEVVEDYLASLFKQRKILDVSARAQNQSNFSEEHDEGVKPLFESQLQNLDRRVGTQEITIVGIGLYDVAGKRIASIFHGEDVVLRFSFKNHSCLFIDQIQCGYIFKNSRGETVSSSNSMWEEVLLPIITIGAILTVEIRITLPLLSPGSYAFTPTVGYKGCTNGEVVMADRIENAILLQVLAVKKVTAMMRFISEYHFSGARN